MEFREFIAEAPRIKVVRIRIRNGKVQRRKKVSGVKGFKIKSGRLVRMSTTERLHRKRGQRRGRIKRRAKLARTLMKRARSIRRLKAMGGMR